MGPIFELISTVETEVVLSDDIRWPCRVELFQNRQDSREFSCCIWQQELFRLTLTFPMDEQNNPEHVSDDHIFVERGIPGSNLASLGSTPFSIQRSGSCSPNGVGPASRLDRRNDPLTAGAVEEILEWDKIIANLMIELEKTTERIISIPIAFGRSQRSPLSLLAESGYLDLSDAVTAEALANALRNHPSLINDWLHWSENKRSSSGWYFKMMNPGTFVVGYYPRSDNRKTKEYSDGFIAAADFIKNEIEEIRKARWHKTLNDAGRPRDQYSPRVFGMG